MAFNPALPADNSLIVSGELRNQFNGLKTLIDNVPAGPPGPQGPQGEVSTAQLEDAISGTALNPSGIGPFGGGFSDPPTQAELQDFASYVESLRVALTR